MNSRNFTKYLPGRLFLVSFAVSALVVGLTYRHFLGAQEAVLARGDSPAVAIAGLASEKDSDNDGFKDWEEVLWKTDLKNPDSDGDGTSDGEEVRQNRNPTVPGPNDTITFDIFTQSASSTEPLNATDKLARDFFARYLLEKSQGGKITKPTEEEIVASVLSRKDLFAEKKIYMSEDISVSSDNSTESLRNYANTMGKIIKEKGSWNVDLVKTLETALQKNDKEELQKLDPVIDSLSDMTQAMLAVKTPSSMAETHLQTLGGLSGMRFAVKGFRNALNDPVTALASLEIYKKDAEGFLFSAKNVGDFFKKRRITFSTGDDAMYYLYLYQLSSVKTVFKK